MRRLVCDIVEGKAIGDTTTLADPAVVAKLKDQYESGVIINIRRLRAIRSVISDVWTGYMLPNPSS